MSEWIMLIFHIIMVAVIAICGWMAVQSYQMARRKQDNSYLISMAGFLLFGAFEMLMYVDLLRILYFGGGIHG